MTTTQGATQALRLTLPGAPNTWHSLGGIDGLFHTDFAVPIEVYGLDEDEAKKLAGRKGVPLALEEISDADAAAATAAYADRLADTATAAPDLEPSLAGLTKPQLVEHAAALDPPLELSVKASKPELLAAIAAHQPAAEDNETTTIPDPPQEG